MGQVSTWTILVLILFLVEDDDENKLSGVLVSFEILNEIGGLSHIATRFRSFCILYFPNNKLIYMHK
jgi:hypothetical protein